MSKTFVFYHRSCYDGALAAAVLIHHIAQTPSLSIDDYEFVAWNYGEKFDDMQKFRGCDVVLLDLTFENEVLEAMNSVADSVTVIDHHPRVHQQVALYCRPLPQKSLGNTTFITDSESTPQSGAQLVWNYYMEGEQPDCVRWVGKGDLWIFDEPEIRPFRLGLGELGLSPFVWQKRLLEFKGEIEVIVRQGRAIAASIDSQLEYLTTNAVSQITIAGHTVPAVNAPRFLASELGERLCNMFPNAPFAAVYYDEHGTRCYSLRSKKGSGMDVGAVAKLFGDGAGGHVHAAGFRVRVHSAPLDPPAPQLRKVSILDKLPKRLRWR